MSVSPIGSDHSTASGRHRPDETVHQLHVDVPPCLDEGLLQFLCSCGPWESGVYLPLDVVPEVLDGVQVWTHRWPLHQPDALLLQVASGEPGGVRAGVVLLQGQVGVASDVRHDSRPEHLVAVSRRRYAIPTSCPDVSEDHGPHQLV